MVTQGVIDSTHAKTQDRTAQKARKHQHISGGSRGVARGDGAQQHDPAPKKKHSPEQVGPNIDGLVVHRGNGRQRPRNRVAGGPVARRQEGIIAPPRRQVVP